MIQEARLPTLVLAPNKVSLSFFRSQVWFDGTNHVAFCQPVSVWDSSARKIAQEPLLYCSLLEPVLTIRDVPRRTGPGFAAHERITRIVPQQCGGILCELLRLLLARSVQLCFRHLHRQGTVTWVGSYYADPGRYNLFSASNASTGSAADFLRSSPMRSMLPQTAVLSLFSGRIQRGRPVYCEKRRVDTSMRTLPPFTAYITYSRRLELRLRIGLLVSRCHRCGLLTGLGGSNRLCRSTTTSIGCAILPHDPCWRGETSSSWPQ